MRSTTQEQSAGKLRLELLDLEAAFLHAVEVRVQRLGGIIDPTTGRIIERIRLRERTFSRHARTDSQAAHLALLRAGHTAPEIESIINAMPVNAASAWYVEAPTRKLLGDPEYEATGLLIAAACWSPLDELARGTVESLRPASASDVERMVKRMNLELEGTAIWLAIASTTGWQGVVPSVMLTNVHCAYFQPAPYGGWATAPGASVEGHAAWFADAVRPETDAQLERRLARWFAAEGRALGMAHSGLSVDEVAAMAGVPAGAARAFLTAVAHDEAGRWLYEDGRSRLLFLGP